MSLRLEISGGPYLVSESLSVAVYGLQMAKLLSPAALTKTATFVNGTLMGT